MRPEGQPFDPTYHEAMLQEQTDEYPDGTVIEQLVRGYLLGDHVLRHALVKVAAPKESVIPSEDEAQAQGQEETNHSENEDC
jgi:molecular chaperone GrpE